MELFIEKEFLDNFYLAVDNDRLTKGEEVFIKILTEYGDKAVFIDYDVTTPEELQSLKQDNLYFALAFNTSTPKSIVSVKDYLFTHSHFKQTLVFMNKDQEWFGEAECKGALCFSFGNYEQKIKTIIDQLHFKIDLSASFLGWSFLESFKVLNYNSIVISDRYILTDKENQNIADNIIPLLSKIIRNPEREVNIKIFTKDLNPISDACKHQKEKARKRYQKLNSAFLKYKTKFYIILNDFPLNDYDYKMHDRYLATNFSLLDCGEGFNLIPHKGSDSQIISETIFDIYTYKRLNNLKKMRALYVQRLQGIETSKFKMYP